MATTFYFQLPEARQADFPTRLPALGAGVLRIQSWKGMAFAVPASTDLDQWSPLTTVTNLSGTLEFAELDAANHLRRFHRTVLR